MPSMSPARPAWLLVLFTALSAAQLGTGCASSAPSVKRTMSVVPASSSVLVGKFGLYTNRNLRPLFLELQAFSVADGKKWSIPLSTDDLDKQGSSAAFFVELPPGWYRLTKWQYTTSSRAWSGESTGALFKLEPGQIACIGAIYVGSKGEIPTSFGTAVHFKSGTLVRDECKELADTLKTKAPLLPTPATQLAHDLDK
jgi:hypothetical protein